MTMNIHDYYGLIFTVLFNIGPLFQLYDIVKRKSSYNVNMMTWACGVIGQIFVLMYLSRLNDTGFFNYANSTVGLLLNLSMVILIVKYRPKKQ